MHLIMLGINHRTAPVALREKLAPSEAVIRRSRVDARSAANASFSALATDTRKVAGS